MTSAERCAGSAAADDAQSHVVGTRATAGADASVVLPDAWRIGDRRGHLCGSAPATTAGRFHGRALARAGRIAFPAMVFAAGIGLVSACAEPPEPVSPTTTTAARTETPQERDQRIREQLIELGCSTNSCIQIYFGCRDGYITGPPCDFYRRHPL